MRAELGGMDWAGVRARVFDRLDPISRDGRAGRIDTPWITVYTGHARFTGARTLQVEGETLTADNIVVATGSRPVVPPPVADAGLPFETSDTIMRSDRAPRRLAVLGGGYIAAELAHVFAAAGAEIVMIEMADTLLGGQDETVAREFTARAAERYDLRLGREATRVSGEPGALRIALDDGTTVEADTLLVAVGRVPNGDRMDLDAAGVDVDEAGRVVVDAHQRTTAEGVWALGDVCTPVPLKHVANREADVVRHNLRHPDDLVSAGHDLVPSAVFTHPQIAAVGATEQELRDRGVDYRVGLARYGETAYGWATEDETGFCKVLVDPADTAVLGAHIMGLQAPTSCSPSCSRPPSASRPAPWSSVPTGCTRRSPKWCNKRSSLPCRRSGELGHRPVRVVEQRAHLDGRRGPDLVDHREVDVRGVEPIREVSGEPDRQPKLHRGVLGRQPTGQWPTRT